MDNLMSTDAHAKLMAELKAHQEKQNSQKIREMSKPAWTCPYCGTSSSCSCARA